MPYKSDAQRKFFNANRAKLEAQGVDVDEWNESSRGKKLPEKVKKAQEQMQNLSLKAALVHKALKKAADKQAVTVAEGDPFSRGIASTLGRLNPDSLIMLGLTRNALSDPSRNLAMDFNEKKFNKHKTTAELIAKYDPKALENTLVRLGGGDIIDDLIYKKDRGENLPWSSRIGGRVWQNPKTSIIGKLMGTLAAPLNYALVPVSRASNYSHFTDVANVYQDEEPITEHELGHALDFSRLYGLRPGEGSNTILGKIKKQLKGGLQDAYMAGYIGVPLIRLLAEAQANIESQKALNFALKDDPEELHRRTTRRLEVLPGAYGSYVGAAIPGFGPLGPLAGMAVGKGLGMAGAAAARQSKANKDKKRNSDSESAAKKPELIPDLAKTAAKLAHASAL